MFPRAPSRPASTRGGQRIEAAGSLFNRPSKPPVSPGTTLLRVPPTIATNASAVPGVLPTVGWRTWFPNALTALRLVIAAGFFVLLAVSEYHARDLVAGEPKVTALRPIWTYLFAAALFGLAAVTDAFDGPLARRWKVVSKFGRVMDPFADKVLVLGSLVMLAGPRFSTDLSDGTLFHVSGVRPWMVESDGRDFSADWSGKAKMILQASLIPLVLVLLGITEVRPGSPGRLAIDAAVWTTLIVTVLSAIPYLFRARQALSK